MKNNHQQCITTPNIYKQTFPLSLPGASPTFPKIWSRVILSKFWDIPKRVFLVLLYSPSDCRLRYVSKKHALCLLKDIKNFTLSPIIYIKWL